MFQQGTQNPTESVPVRFRPRERKSPHMAGFEVSGATALPAMYLVVLRGFDVGAPRLVDVAQPSAVNEQKQRDQ